MPDLHYDDPILAEIYDLTCGWSEDRQFYLDLAGPAPQSVLDLGCGTGLICSRYEANGHDVTGADPSASMLDVARRTYGSEIDWVLAGAQDFRSDKRFDLIIMTGHTFQVFENDADITAVLAVMRDHLTPGGGAVFESRNPAIDWATRWQGNTDRIDYHGTPVHYRIKVVGWTGDRLTFEQHYAFPDRTLISTSTLRFASRAEIEALIAKAGLVVDWLRGDWQHRPFDAKTSDEMIFAVRLP